uniref:Uncharacterized protein n=1 Tax=Capitella teleta TaxID=283909 RepID=X1ZS57_CAPTE
MSPNNFSLCVVTVKSDFETVLSDTSNPSQNFFYHRLDLETVPGECEYLSATATIDHSVVLLSPAAFEEPYLQVIREETVNDIESYRSYFTGGPATYPGFKEFVFDYVAASAYFDDIMVGQADGLLDSVVWAYVGFKVGVFRLYPGTRLAQEYDALKRPWYKRAITQKGRISFSIPYEDAFGAGAVITMSKTLLAGRADNSHDDSDPVVGVMGLDFTMNVFYYFMTDAFPECADPDNLGCFMVDDGGFVVMHHDWLDLDDKHAAYNVHIAAKEPGVAKILIEENLMHRLGCINHEDRLNQFTWLDGPLPACVAWTQVQCTCADKFEFNFCQNKPELDTRDSYPPCAAFEDNSLTPLPPSRMSKDLKQCHHYDCEPKSKRAIFSRWFGWCGSDNYLHLLLVSNNEMSQKNQTRDLLRLSPLHISMAIQIGGGAYVAASECRDIQEEIYKGFDKLPRMKKPLHQNANAQ